MNYKKFIVFLISCGVMLLGNVLYTLSCGPEPDPYDYYISFFNPYTKGQGYEPFYYSSLSTFYDETGPSEAVANVIDWQRYTGSKVTGPDIQEYIYTYPVAQMATIAAGTSTLPDSVQRNTFVQYLLQEKNREAARYLLFAKTCEPMAVVEDRWSAPNRNEKLMLALYKEGEELYQQTKNKDIRDRYAYQLIRLQHYSQQYKAAITDFDKWFDRKGGNSLIYYKSLSLKAGALLHMEDSVQSAYLFSRVFDKAPSLRISTFISLRWTAAQPEAVYALCKDDKEKASVAAVYGFNKNETDLELLKKVYAFDPGSPALSVLLGREISKLENGYLSPQLSRKLVPGDIVSLSEYDRQEIAEMESGLRRLQVWIDGVVDKGKLKDPELWRISSAYLAYMQQDYTTAANKLQQIKVKDPALKDHWEIVNLLVNINQQKTMDSTFESRLLSSFQWLDTKIHVRKADEWYHSDKDYFFNKTYRNLLFAILAPRYHQEGKFVKEALIRSRCEALEMNDYFIGGQSGTDLISNDMKPAALLQLHSFLQQPGKSPFDTYLADAFPKKLSLEKVIGTSYMRIHDFKHAQEWLKKVPAARQEVSYQVFRDQLQDFGNDEAVQGYTRKITQLQFCERMVALEEKMKIVPVPAKVYYDYATALFNISYYGKTWSFLKDYRPSSDWYDPADNKDTFRKQYFGCYSAESYYLKAAQATTDRELKARCIFMAARCSQKHIPVTGDDQKDFAAWLHNRYFPLLNKSYSDTRFFQQEYNQCSYLRDYVKSAVK
ncbi:hypothetical protein [Chitinophaga nivalis]|uniref:Uncharacterized protein n=1 Tax=Chitinophaga nivalis TaxID=2991709 RepID=A0ABT3IF53_9BACT|nr:hypothetical protein [Chitinophaga nivalis]MCW3467714.1 hypothetical protein [Chitinophaga nivalis]MCW3482594.1 hypothetical protein [Chitinophaga nivalis]